jgi:hypothetical protein
MVLRFQELERLEDAMMNGDYDEDDQIQSGDAHEQQGTPSPPDPPTAHQQQVPPLKEGDFPPNQQPKPTSPQPERGPEQPKPEQPSQSYIPVR